MKLTRLERLNNTFSLAVDEWFKTHCGKRHYSNADARKKDLELMAEGKNNSALDECAEWLTSSKKWAAGIADRKREEIRERLIELASKELCRNEKRSLEARVTALENMISHRV